MHKSNIDFNIIWRKIHFTISEDESQELENWLRYSPKHRELFNNAVKFYKEGSSFSRKPANKNKALKNIKARISRKIVFTRIVASVAILFIIATVTYVFQIDSFDPEEIIAKNIEPKTKSGKQKAILILDDGTAKQLTTKSSIKIRQGQTILQQSEEGLSYVSTIKKADQLIYNTIKIPRGGEFFLELSDKTKVWLNSETILRYPVTFANDNRIVELTGEAYFEVTKDAKRPFNVLSSKHTVQVLGTQFNVSSYPDDDNIKTTLVEGSVNVKAGDADVVTLKPGFQSVYNPVNDIIATEKVNVEEFVIWKKGLFYFKNQSLEDMMTTLERWYNVSVFFSDTVCKDVKFTGKIKRYESLENILSVIEETNEISFEVTQDEVFITRK
ncbi:MULTISPECIES: FecR family protein [unclassified Saccharicrinis]|uniref:FecR family protein n=1 Tax=unclassified Saccharicrinis TaxID=2646859 RepID=UPI003D33FF0C